MGQARQKAKQLEDWKTGLSAEEKIVFEIAYRLHNKFIVPRNATGMCYHSVFFMYLHLKETHGIITSPVVAYVNDATDDIFISHAWLEFNDKRTDVSLAITDARMGPPGQLVILDRVMKSGHEYGYYLEIPEEGPRAHETLRLGGSRALLEHKEKQHAEMSARINDDEAIRAYLDAEPNGSDYNKIKSLI